MIKFMECWKQKRHMMKKRSTVYIRLKQLLKLTLHHLKSFEPQMILTSFNFSSRRKKQLVRQRLVWPSITIIYQWVKKVRASRLTSSVLIRLQAWKWIRSYLKKESVRKIVCNKRSRKTCFQAQNWFQQTN